MISRWIQSKQVRRRMQSVAQALAWGGLLGMALIALLQTSAARASILPPVTPDATFTGDSVGSQFGFAVAPAGDVNGDGYADLLVGAPIERSIYVYTGSVSGFSQTEFFSQRSDQSNNFFGHSVDGGGDINGDGLDDFIVGAYGGNATGPTTQEGIVFVYHGAAVQPSLAITVAGEAYDDQFGYSVAMAGDVNGDGFDDVIVGAPKYADEIGRAYLYHGSDSGIGSTPALTLTGEANGDFFGYSVDGAGDVNGDGFDDVVIGAWHHADPDIDAGKAYVYFGSSTGITTTDPFSVTGNPNSELGVSVAGAGDVNGDGYADILVGAYRDDVTAPGAGAAYLYWGSANGPVTPGVLVAAGEAENDELGFAVSGAGDINGDDFDDLLVGAYLNDAAGEDAGKAYAYAGCMGGLLPGAVFIDTGEYEYDGYGLALAGIGDVNGDGVEDIAVGAFGGKQVDGDLQVPHGKVYVYYGAEGGGCEAKVTLEVTLGLADTTPPACGTNNTLAVPANTDVVACYRVQNTGALTLTQHSVIDGLWGQLVTVPLMDLAPNASYIHMVTHTVTADASGPITWTAGVPVTGPDGASPNPPDRMVTATATATATVTLSQPVVGPPTIYLPMVIQ